MKMLVYSLFVYKFVGYKCSATQEYC